MANRYLAHIIIGGQLASQDVARLIWAINADAPLRAWDDEGRVSVSSREEIQKLLDERGHLNLYDPQASWGEFSNLEETCKELGLAFDRYSDGEDGEDGERASLRAGMLTQVPTNAAGEIMVELAEVKTALELLEAGETEELYRHLRDLVEEPSPLPPLQIVDMVACAFCGEPSGASEAHLHQGVFVGDCCWDERLRATE